MSYLIRRPSAFADYLRKAESARGYSRRLAHRRLAWWITPYRRSDWRFYPWALHQLEEKYFLRYRDDPKERWDCCEHWQRTLISKWNSREFVHRFGVPVPELYWTGRRVHNLPIDRLPARFAIRPIWGTGRRGVHVIVDDRKLIGKGPPNRNLLLRQLVEERGRFNFIPLLCEEAIVRETGELRLPLEIKCHMFAGFVGAVQVIVRSPHDEGISSRFYDQGWIPFEERMYDKVPQLPIQEPPPYLQSLLNWGKRLGSAIGTYMRVDFFGTEDRCVFNEFSSTPGTRYNTPYQDELFESLWQTHISDQT